MTTFVPFDRIDRKNEFYDRINIMIKLVNSLQAKHEMFYQTSASNYILYTLLKRFDVPYVRYVTCICMESCYTAGVFNNFVVYENKYYIDATFYGDDEWLQLALTEGQSIMEFNYDTIHYAQNEDIFDKGWEFTVSNLELWITEPDSMMDDPTYEYNLFIKDSKDIMDDILA